MSEVLATETPEPTALYRVWGDAGLLLYIGVSNDFGRRWKQHARQQPWWGEMKRLTADEWFASRPEAEEAEAAAIKAERPKYNIVHNEMSVARTRRRPAPGTPEPDLSEPIEGVWFPVRIPDREGAPVHRADILFMCGPRRPGVFTMAEQTLSDVATVEAMIAAAESGEEREGILASLDYWRENYKFEQVVWKMLDAVERIERHEKRPEMLARARKTRIAARRYLGFVCHVCNEEPPAGMTCRECDMEGTEWKPRQPLDSARKRLAIAGTDAA